jgi:hypothetical protein
VALKIRVTASHGSPGRGPLPPFVYRAEAYDEGDGFREPKWGCDHDHKSVEEALDCGHSWLEGTPPVKSSV